VTVRARAQAFARAGLIACVVIVLDQVTKALVTGSLRRGDRVELLPGLDLINVGNTGVAFGALAGGGRWIVALTAAALVLLLAYFVRHAERRLAWLPVGLVIGGALGNLTDRAREGAVIDFIDPVAWPAFNLADSAIVVGVLGLLIAIERQAGAAGQTGPAWPAPGARAPAWPEPRGLAEARREPGAPR